MTHTIDTWHGCYPSDWNGKIVQEAMSHPAKYSSRLIRKIYEHIKAEGWAGEGDKVVDPFGGVALGSLDAMRLGMHWQGIELEARFHGLGNQNIEKWMRDFGTLPRWGSAQLHNGDSRYLLDVLQSATVSISSPPYEETTVTVNRQFKSRFEPNRPPANDLRNDGGDAYGFTPGQLGTMKAQGFEVAISSPPFLQSEGGTPEPKPGGAIDARLYARHAAGNKSANGYGKSEGQLSSMKEGGFNLAVSSPPFMSEQKGGGIAAAMNGGEYNLTTSMPGKNSGYQNQAITSANLASSSNSDDFWLAARQIVEQVYAVLVPGGHACWVVKDYVKNKKIVPFCDQWRQLCEAVGFTTIHEHRASLVRNVRHQHTMEGGLLTMQSESKSFFRRMAEKKGSPRIDWETVYCMEKPE